MATAVDLGLYLPFDSGAGANVMEEGWRRMAKHFRYDGVIRGEGQDFRIRGDSSGMKIKLDPGECFIRGHWGAQENTIEVPVANSSSQIRRDLAVLRLNTQTNRISAQTIEGTPGSSSWPSPVRTTTIWDIQLGQITVGANVNTISSGSVRALPHYTDGSARYVVDANTQQVPNTTDTRVDWDISEWDSSAIDRSGLNTFVIQRAGMWQIVPTLRFTPSSGTFYVYVARTGQAGTNRIGANSGFSDGVSCVALDRFQVADTVQIWCWHNSGGTRNILNSFNQTSVAFYWLGP